MASHPKPVCLVCNASMEDEADRAVRCCKCDGPAHPECFPITKKSRGRKVQSQPARHSWVCKDCSTRSSVRNGSYITTLSTITSQDRAEMDYAQDHNIFTQTLLPGEPINGKRRLRKRKLDEMRNSNGTLPSDNDSNILHHGTNTRVEVSSHSPTSLIVKLKFQAMHILQGALGEIPNGEPDPTNQHLGGEVEKIRVDEKRFGGLLSFDEADTSTTMPTQSDRARFDDIRLKAIEQVRRRKVETQNAHRKHDELLHATYQGASAASKIKCIHFGEYEIDTWYAAPYPEEYSRNRVLYICEFCLRYLSSDFVAWRHQLKCPMPHPPGDEIYRHGNISIFEVDGRKNPTYCQNLCLLAKMFLGSKTLYYDVEPFFFYVMTELRDSRCHLVGYFSKEKRSASGYNLSCILTLPIHQRKGYGNFLIEFSYLLSKTEGKCGSPEKPLSDLGLVSYRNFWKVTLSRELRNQYEPVSIEEISRRTSMTPDDIISALEGMEALLRDPVTGTYAMRLDHAKMRAEWEKAISKGYVKVDPDKLLFAPWVPGRGLLYTDAPILPAKGGRDAVQDAEKRSKMRADSEQRGLVLAVHEVSTTSTKKKKGGDHGHITFPHTPPSSDASVDSLQNEHIPLDRFTLAAPRNAAGQRTLPGTPSELSRTRGGQRQRDNREENIVVADGVGAALSENAQPSATGAASGRRRGSSKANVDVSTNVIDEPDSPVSIPSSASSDAEYEAEPVEEEESSDEPGLADGAQLDEESEMESD